MCCNPANGRVDFEEWSAYKIQLNGIEWIVSLSADWDQSLKKKKKKKELQVTLKNALKKIDVLDVKSKVGIDNFDEENITRFRSNCKNPKLRNIYFRLIHNDFFTHVRMKKYRMTLSDEWPRWGITETSKHLLYECAHERNIWSLFNNLMSQIGNDQQCINNYEDVFQTPDPPAISIVKAKIIQALIQIERPMNWNREKLLDIIKDLINVECYNAIESRTINKFNVKWNLFKI
jgi:hypothetical protein